MSISRRELVLLVVAIYMFIGFLAYQYLYRPAEEEYLDLQSRQNTLQEQLVQAKKLEQGVKHRESRRAEMAESISQLYQLQEKLPGDKEHLQVIEFLGQLAREKGLRLQSLDYKDQARVKEEGATGIRFHLSMTGPYYKLLAYLDELESLPRVFTIDSISLNMVSKEDNSQAQEIGGEYYYNSNPPPSAPEPKGSRISQPYTADSSPYQAVQAPKQPASSKYDINNWQMTLQITTYYAPLSSELEKI